MNGNFRRKAASGAALTLLLVIFAATTVLSAPPEPVPNIDGGRSFEGEVPGIVILAEPEERVSPRRFLPAQDPRTLAKTSDFQVNYLPSQAAWPAEAINAFEYAVSIWESTLSSSVPIRIDATYDNMGDPYILGGAGTEDVRADFSNAPMPGTWYPMALANKLAGTDLKPGKADIIAEFNNQFDWYFGISGTPGPGQYDFASVVLHEMGHGLGFLGSTSVSGSNGGWGYSLAGGSKPYLPTVYDRWVYNGSGQQLIDTNIFANPSRELATQLTSGNLYLTGNAARQANGGQSVKMFAPNPWQQGSSYSHMDENFNGTINDLMTYSLAPREVQHQIGPVVMGILKDLGWTVSSPVQPTATAIVPTATPRPTVTPLPPFTPVAYEFLPAVGKNFQAKQPTATPQPGALTFSGEVRVNGAVGSGIVISLYSYNLNTRQYLQLQTTETDSAGRYTFTNVPAIPAQTEYFAYYDNVSETYNGLAADWFSNSINQTTSKNNSFGVMDIGDIVMNSPVPGAIRTLPLLFEWTKRPNGRQENYQFYMFDPSGAAQEYYGPEALNTSYTLTSLPSGYLTFQGYYWQVWGIGQNGDFGLSYWARRITFMSAGAQSDALQTEERAPQRDLGELYAHGRSLR